MVGIERKDYWLKKLAWFVMENMNEEISFFEVFAESFNDNDIHAFDLLTDDLFVHEVVDKAFAKKELVQAENEDFSWCPYCGCNEALITSKGEEGMTIYCPACVKWYEVVIINEKIDKIREKIRLWVAHIFE